MLLITCDPKEQKAAASLGITKEKIKNKAGEMFDFSRKLYEKHTKVWYIASKKGGFDESIGMLKIPGAFFEAMK